MQENEANSKYLAAAAIYTSAYRKSLYGKRQNFATLNGNHGRKREHQQNLHNLDKAY